MLCNSHNWIYWKKPNQVFKKHKLICKHLLQAYIFLNKLFNSTLRGCKFCLQLILEVFCRTEERVGLKEQDAFWGKRAPWRNAAADTHWWVIIALVNLDHSVTKYREKSQYYANCALNYSVSVFTQRKQKSIYCVRAYHPFGIQSIHWFINAIDYAEWNILYEDLPHQNVTHSFQFKDLIWIYRLGHELSLKQTPFTETGTLWKNFCQTYFFQFAEICSVSPFTFTFKYLCTETLFLGSEARWTQNIIAIRDMLSFQKICLVTKSWRIPADSWVAWVLNLPACCASSYCLCFAGEIHYPHH